MADIRHPLLAIFRPMEDWDRRDQTVLLLVDYRDGGDHALDDADVAITIGHNNDHNVEPEAARGWQFAGWSWWHDCYVQGVGKPIGWMPLPHGIASAVGNIRPCSALENPSAGRFDYTISDDGVMTALPTWQRDCYGTFLRLMLVGGHATTLHDVALLTDEQLQEADIWAWTSHLSASDNEDIQVPARPTFLREGSYGQPDLPDKTAT